MNTRDTIFILATVAVFCVFGWAVSAKENTLKNGDTVLLELAPADPRSLMQGDYMRLNYKIANELRQVDGGQGFRAMRREKRTNGYIVVRVQQNGVAEFLRQHEGEPLNSDERLVKFSRKGWGVEIVPNSFLFQEGHAKYYGEAKYGVFRFDGDKGVLAGLADADRKLITPPATAKAVSPSP